MIRAPLGGYGQRTLMIRGRPVNAKSSQGAGGYPPPIKTLPYAGVGSQPPSPKPYSRPYAGVGTQHPISLAKSKPLPRSTSGKQWGLWQTTDTPQLQQGFSWDRLGELQKERADAESQYIAGSAKPKYLQYGIGVAGANLGIEEANANSAFAQEFYNNLMRGFDIDEAYANAMHTSRGSVFGLQEEGVKHEGEMSRRKWSSDVTARGAMGAPGTSWGFSDIEQQTARSLGLLGEERVQEGAGYEREKGQIGVGREKAGIDLRKEQSGYDFIKRRYGLDKKQAHSQLTEGLRRLGLDRVLKVNELAAIAASQDPQKATIAMNLFAQIFG